MRLDSIRWPVFTVVVLSLLASVPRAAQASKSDRVEAMDWIVSRLDKYGDKSDWSWDDDSPCTLVQEVQDSEGKAIRRITFSLGDVGQVETGRLRINLEMRGATAKVEDLGSGESTRTSLVEIRLKLDDIRDDLEEALDDAIKACVKHGD